MSAGGYIKKDVRLLFRFIDWLMALPPDLHITFNEQLLAYEEDKKMPYLSGVERMVIEREVQKERQLAVQEGIQQGIQQGIRENIIEVLQVRFTEIPQTLIEALETITNPDTLKNLHRQAISVESVAAFQRLVEEAMARTDADEPAPNTDS